MAEAKKEENEQQKWSPVEESLFDRRIVQISGPVNEKLAYRVNREILAMAFRDESKPIYLFINSPGGEVYSGFSIFDTAKFVKPTIHTVVIGLAASMGSLIALAAEKKNRTAFPNAKLLIHARDMIKLKEKINRLYSEETGRSYDEIVKATDRDKWFDPEEAKEFGLIDRVVSSVKDLKV